MGKAKRVGKGDEPDPVAKVFSIPEVLEIIMNDLDVGSLLNCRLVNTFWDKRASSVLKRRPAWIEVSASSDSFARLYKCVSKSKDFPFPGLKLTAARDTDRHFDRLTTKAPKYFRKFGQIHTHLKIGVGFPHENDLIENVLSLLPNIKFLRFDRLVRGDEEEGLDLDLEQFSMPNLTTLSFLGLCGAASERVLRAVINAAPALENIEDLPLELVPTIWEDVENVNLVSSMILKDNMSRSISQQLIANPPSVKILSILRGKSDQPSRVFVTALKKVFLRSKNALKKLVINNVYINLDQVPVFKQLRQVDITTYKNGSEEDSFDMVRKLSSKCFPNLHQIRLNLNSDMSTEVFNLVDGNKEVLASVKVLELESHLIPEVVKFLAEKIPFVRHIRVNYPRADTCIWSLGVFPCLSKLDIRGFPLDTKRFFTQTMDQFLTGIPREICAKLRTIPPFEMDPFYNEIMRPSGSLLQLRALKELTVSILPFAKAEELSEENPFMSMISLWYAMKFRPGLRMKLLCRPSKLSVVKKAVESVQDYVSVVAWTEPEVFY